MRMHKGPQIFEKGKGIYQTSIIHPHKLLFIMVSHDIVEKSQCKSSSYNFNPLKTITIVIIFEEFIQ